MLNPIGTHTVSAQQSGAQTHTIHCPDKHLNESGFGRSALQSVMNSGYLSHLLTLLQALLEELSKGQGNTKPESGPNPLPTTTTGQSTDQSMAVPETEKITQSPAVPPSASSSGISQATSPQPYLSAAERETLRYTREEEKLARDVYSALYERWDNPIFANISSSEQRHTDRVADMLQRYGIDDPVTTNAPGVFQNPELQQLYNELVARGQSSLSEALKVGGYIEELDIRDLQGAIDESSNSELDQMYANLMQGSENHLRSFVGQLTSREGGYSAQLLDQSEIDRTLSEATAKGTGHGGGIARP